MSWRENWRSNVNLNYFSQRPLSKPAQDLIEFDADSIRQAVASQRSDTPETWLVDPDEYEKNGRVFRDSESLRMLAYSEKNRIVYGTDGCNSCALHLSRRLDDFSAVELRSFAEQNELRIDLLEKLSALVRKTN